MTEFMQQAVSGFSIVDVLDIVIVAYLIYRITLLIRHTRAMSLIKGIIALVIVTIVSDYTNLKTTHWLLSNVWTLGAVAAVVVFQPELRRALEQLGRGKLLSKPFFTKTEFDVSELVEKTVKAMVILSKNKIGALIVIERDTGVGDYMETGIDIDSLVSSELLLNIFIPNTPLHDGAVMIRNNRIVAAACYLPLTNRKDLDKDLGTRHRAALGITEDTDALAIVVSEETGSISLAENGSLNRHLDRKSLGDLLLEKLQREHDAKSFPIKVRRPDNSEETTDS